MGTERIARRMDVIDAAKGIGILLVVFCHVNFTPIVLTVVYGFHMPLFFLLSGLMFRREKYPTFASFFARRVKTLILPYVFFYLTAVVITFVLQVIIHGFSLSLVADRAKGLLQMVLAQGGSGQMVLSPFWFILSLFAVEILYYFISGLRSRWAVAILCAALSCLGWFLQSDLTSFPNHLLPWNLDSSLFVLGFYAFGNLLQKQILQFISFLQTHSRKLLLCAAVIVLCLVIYLPIARLNGKISIGSKALGNGFWLYLTGITGTFAVLAVSILVQRLKFLTFCGRSSFCIMAVHCIVINAMETASIVSGKLFYDSGSFVQSLLPFALVTLLSAAAALGYTKFLSSRTVPNK